MPYFIRVLGTEVEAPTLDQLRENASPALIENLSSAGGTWTELALKHVSGEEIAIIERSGTADGLGADEISEFIDEVSHYEPAKAARWLQSYLPNIKVVYAFQVLAGTDVQDGWARLHAVYSFVWNQAKGILQADGEGFSNEDGYTILWQFGPNATGTWNAAVLDSDERWTKFQMDLGNAAQRAAFKRGELPPGATPVSDS